jgi:hypothetical protein
MEKYKLNVVNKTLTITKGFAKAMATGEGDEYNLYTRLMQEIPGLTVVRKTHRTPTKCTSSSGEVFKCNQFKNLTYENMERFMAALPENEAYFEEYSFVRYAAATIQTNRYALVRKWFTAQFPEFRKNPLFYLYNKPEIVKAAKIIEMQGEAA